MKVFKFYGFLIKLMKYAVKIEVCLKSGYSNPEGETTAHLLKELGYQVEKVNVGKVYTVTLNISSPAEAKAVAEEMSKRLLVNPIKDNYTISVVE
ncbi:MAG: phosphoribosylformylglycinamidine synthase subunit PurS [Nitrososphaerota archaeon]|jgi:phosphoribosylformylglycinamidine synthase PurS subunit|nr:phosphoribosylformylglycinamidine synthase subunit PurS [Nitrososphaerota archaeon]